MDQVCGIYKITNLIDGKSYIGQSIHISSRWKQHTQSLDKVKNPNQENPLRRAFLEYGMLQQVSRPGIYKNFKFEILLECEREKLTENEYAKIDELQPEYNRMMCPPSEDRVWPQKERLEKSCYVQYHNYNEREYLPFECYGDKPMEDDSYTISSKRITLRTKGEKVYLIVGIKQKGHKQKDFYLWNYTQVEEIEVIEDNDGSKKYGVRGTEFLCLKPIRLNGFPGFEHFVKHTMGSFAYGMQNTINDPFCKYLTDEKNFVSLQEMNQPALDWYASFEERLDDDSMKLTDRLENGELCWRLFEREIDEEGVYCRVRDRFWIALNNDPLFVAREFEKFRMRNPEVNAICSNFLRGTKEFVLNIHSFLHYISVGPIDDYPNELVDELRELSKMKNVFLIDSDGNVFKVE